MNLYQALKFPDNQAPARMQRARPSAAATCASMARSVNAWVSERTSLVISLLFFAAITIGILGLQQFLHGSNPQIMLFLAPVAYAGFALGWRPALLSSLAVIVVSWIILFQITSDQVSALNRILSFFTLMIAAPGLSCLTGYMRKMMGDLYESEQRRLSFNREVLLAVTGGRLQLCTWDELRAIFPEEGAMNLRLSTLEDLAPIRDEIRNRLDQRKIVCERTDDLMTCITEAATNALKYARDAEVTFWVSHEKVAFLVSDHGAGISPTDLARATLERGFSTHQTMGLGYTLMLAMADTLALCTSTQGTQIYIEVGTATRGEQGDQYMAAA